MAVLYLDTSALVKLYVQEPGTESMLQLAHPDTGHRLAILSLSRVEFRAAIRRRTRLGDIDPDVAEELIRDFNHHLSSVFQMQPINEAVLEKASELIDRHALRACDATQLAGCAALQTTLGNDFRVVFVCADDNLLHAARSEKIQTMNPMSG
jgi:uncharacterized protein